MVTLAANGSSREFVAHICCQRYLKDVWLGKVCKVKCDHCIIQFKETSPRLPSLPHSVGYSSISVISPADLQQWQNVVKSQAFVTYTRQMFAWQAYFLPT